ncbi:MAG TPA: hypoxanthine phosphoribosyltransferase [Clostridiaceae bacterium]|nr:hypoxanthine phosphoribosyltransferase [Clostridiaceae bacterium]
MSKRIDKVLIEQPEVEAFVKRIAADINRDYAGKKVMLICVLKGAFIFLADLVRELEIECEVDFMAVSSYEGEHSTGVVRILKDLDSDISGKHVIIVEDIVDTGLTLDHLTSLLWTRNPASIKVCTAFDKPSRRKIDCTVDYIGRSIPDEFIVGYGLDYNQYFRNIPFVAVLADDAEETDE